MGAGNQIFDGPSYGETLHEADGQYGMGGLDAVQEEDNDSDRSGWNQYLEPGNAYSHHPAEVMPKEVDSCLINCDIESAGNMLCHVWMSILAFWLQRHRQHAWDDVTL